ncbi:hypothetical protein [Amycolatopsis sp. NPDC021455]|uniref:hypothetical protein n=1 Tax=Amycolatopsis sp. NPDC021455 TaxID=3154901 RepID=UPI0033FCCD61
MNNSTETKVARFMTDTPLPAGPLEVVTSEDPTACCINLLRALHAAEEATQTARAQNLADQAYRRAFGTGYHAEVPAVGVASLGDLSAGALIDVMTR